MGGEAAAAASRFVRLRLELIEEHKVEELGVERDGAHIKEEEEGGGRRRAGEDHHQTEPQLKLV